MIDLSRDPVVTDALREWRDREVMPTSLGSAELRGLGRQVRRRAIFSARTTNADYLAEVGEVVDDMLSGKINQAEGRLRLMHKLAELGYDPAKGFPGDVEKAPPAEQDSLQDLGSTRRLNLMLETNLRQAANFGKMLSGNEDAARFAYPGWRLVRLYSREVPRGTPESHTEGWERRWAEAGKSVSWEGASPLVMAALKDSPIWQALGDGEGGHSDALGQPYPPFAFNSGMAWEAVARTEAIKLGLISGEETPGAMQAQLSPGQREVRDVVARFEKTEPGFRDELMRELAELGGTV